MPQLVDEILQRMDALSLDRRRWEDTWSEIADYVLPTQQRFTPGTTMGNQRYDQIVRGPISVERGRVRYDDTAVRAVDRLAAGMESLVTPQSDKWHGLATADPLGPEETDEEKEYFERYRDYMFAVRYNPKSGFIGAHQKALRSAISLGTGVVFCEENMGASAFKIPALYRYMPLSECYLAINAQGDPDTLYRKFQMTARQMEQRFGQDVLAQPVRTALGQAAIKDTYYEVIHAVYPRSDDAKKGKVGNKAAPWASCYIDADNLTVLGESGFYEFPFIIYYWQPTDTVAYAESPVMMALADIKGLNAMKKVSLRGLQGYMDPAWGVAHDGVMNRVNMNPGKINYGSVTKEGRPQIMALQTGARPDFVSQILEMERGNINESLYITLFQTLAQTRPGETATEAMIRANEKGELLGPAGSKIQHAMSQEVERLAGIIERKGAMHPNSPLAPPDSLRGRSYGARFTSPLDRLRRSSEGLGIQRSLQTALPLMQVDPSVADNFDLDKLVRTVNEIEGAPQDILATTDERDAKRAARQQQQKMQQALEAAKTGGEAAKNIVPAMGQMAQLAGLAQNGAPATGPSPGR